MIRKVTLALVASAVVAAACANDAKHDGAGSAESAKPPTPDRESSIVASDTLTGDSTLADWQAATPAARSQVAVALARNRLSPEASKLDVAKLAMEITGCVSATARDARLGGWKVSPTATTCLTAPERDKK
jgi:hypothetical protein